MAQARLIGAAIAAALAAGALTAAPVIPPTSAEAAVVAPSVVTAIKQPQIDLTLWESGDWGKYGAMFPTKTVALGKTATFKVKATGGKLKYQWWVMNLSGSKPSRKVSGKAGRRAALKLKVSAKTVGKVYSVTVSNAKGRTSSNWFYLQAKRGEIARAKLGNAGRIGKFRVASLGKPVYLDKGQAGLDVLTQNVSKHSANPAKTLRFAYRAPSGKLYKNENFYTFRSGITRVGSVKAGHYGTQFRVKATVPASAKGGYWLVWSTSKPAHKMRLG